MILLLNHPSRDIRSTTLAFYQKNVESDAKFVSEVVSDFYELFQDSSLSGLDHLKIDPRCLVQCCRVLLKSSSKFCDTLCLEELINFLKISHIEILYETDPNLFIDYYCRNCVKTSSISSVESFLQQNEADFVQFVTSSKCNYRVRLNIAKTLAKYFSFFVKPFIEHVVDGMKTEVILIDSLTQDQLIAYLTSQTTQNNESTSPEDTKNKTKKLKDKTPTKQQEDDCLPIQQIVDRFDFYFDLLESLVEFSPLTSSLFLKEVVFIVVPLFTCKLPLPRAAKFFRKINKTMMINEDEYLENDANYVKFVQIASNTIVRLYSEPSFDENLLSIVTKIIDFVHKRTCPPSQGFDEQAARLAYRNRLTAPCFTYIFPLMQYVLLQLDDEIVDNYDRIVRKCLEIIAQHTLLKSQATLILGSPENLKNCQLLPINLMLECIIKFIERGKSLENEDLASRTLKDVVRCVDGQKDEAGYLRVKATSEDISVLLNSLFSSNDTVRESCLVGLDILSYSVLDDVDNCAVREKLVHRIFVAKFDQITSCQELAMNIYDRLGLEISNGLLDTVLYEDIENVKQVFVQPLASAYAFLVEQFLDRFEEVVSNLINFYSSKRDDDGPTKDIFGRKLYKEVVDYHKQRLTVAMIFKLVVKHFPGTPQARKFFDFLIPLALSDTNQEVQQVMLEAGCQLIDLVDEEMHDSVLLISHMFIKSVLLNKKQTYVAFKNVIVLLGKLSKHLVDDRDKINSLIHLLCQSLNCPVSSDVKEAIAACFAELVLYLKPDLSVPLAKNFFANVKAEPDGLEFALAGIVKGLGILSIEELGIFKHFIELVKSSQDSKSREKALRVFEAFSKVMGQLFEPYAATLLPDLLNCFTDSSSSVRSAADETAKSIMAHLSSAGVKVIYPTIVKALGDDNWRKKASAVEFLGSMAYCVPRHLSEFLPIIIPKLKTATIDSHPKVREAAERSLGYIGSVIQNPEIKEIVPVLLAAIQDPSANTNKCLQILLNMKFVHVLDPPSLALIIPVLERAFQTRSTETRKMSSQIVGNMCALTRRADMAPYLTSILKEMKTSLLDPSPNVRSATARALGVMVKGQREITKDLLPWLKDKLISYENPVDRSGAAQGLAEVFGGMGEESLQVFMPEIITVTERTDVAPHIKDGYITLFIHLPVVFKDRFAAYISQVIDSILKALADENELVRETALQAGVCIVNMYADTAIEILLPELEKGIFNESWRIRYCSVQLLGDLLFKIIGVTGKMTTESGHEDDNFGTEESQQALVDSLGVERRNHVLASLYMCRSDIALQVRQASLHVWKVVVSNTPRTLKEILPVLFSILLSTLASDLNEQRQIAAKALGELVHKFGERTLIEIIPIMEEQRKSESAYHRQGVCIGLSEIMANTNKDLIQAFADSLIPTVLESLYDEDPEVRAAASKTFDRLYVTIGSKALDSILSGLIDILDDPELGERSLDGLRHIISLRSKVVLPYLIPKVRLLSLLVQCSN